MIKSFTVTNYLGDSVKIDIRKPEESGFLVQEVSGLGPAKASINTTEMSTNDGSLYNSARLEKRNIVFKFLFVETESKESIEDVRQKSYKYFPMKKNVSLLIETDNREVRTTGYVESNEPDIFSSQESAQVSIVCPDPYFYSAGADGNTLTVFFGTEPTFEFPFSNESTTEPLIVFGKIQNKTENVITYAGDDEIGITIWIHAIGAVSNISIYNIKTGEKMLIDTAKIEALTGSGLVARDDIVINTVKGHKSITLVRGGSFINILNCLGKDTDWFSLAKGDNLFAFTAESGSANLQFRISNQVIYEGI